MDSTYDNTPGVDYIVTIDSSYFTVAEDWEVTLSWDMTDQFSGFGLGGGMALLENGTIINSVTGDGVTGSLNVTLLAGASYQLTMNAAIVGSAFGATGGTTWVHMEKVPAPGALALLGLAGVAGARRRRR